MDKTDVYGLIGFPLEHSFSAEWFNNMFAAEGIDAEYRNFPIRRIEEVCDLLRAEPRLRGFNVTYPYKREIIPFLDELSEEARAIGAVNCVKIDSKGGMKGYNTDCEGFEGALKAFLSGCGGEKPSALVLGSGGSSRAVCYALDREKIAYKVVSRNPEADQIGYGDLTSDVMKSARLIINTTPLGMHPDENNAPDIPYEYLDGRSMLFDLIYNPPVTQFLKLGKERGAKNHNGEAMLIGQAMSAWRILSGG